MATNPFNADDIIQQIDRGALRPIGKVVARSLLRKIDFRHEIITRHDRGEEINPLSGQDALWKQINALPAEQQGALRLLVSLAHEGEIDWYAAEFFILWARQEGLSERAIGDAFGFVPNGS
jgi:hypothetical protein